MRLPDSWRCRDDAAFARGDQKDFVCWTCKINMMTINAVAVAMIITTPFKLFACIEHRKTGLVALCSRSQAQNFFENLSKTCR